MTANIRRIALKMNLSEGTILQILSGFLRTFYFSANFEGSDFAL